MRLWVAMLHRFPCTLLLLRPISSSLVTRTSFLRLPALHRDRARGPRQGLLLPLAGKVSGVIVVRHYRLVIRTAEFASAQVLHDATRNTYNAVEALQYQLTENTSSLSSLRVQFDEHQRAIVNVLSTIGGLTRVLLASSAQTETNRKIGQEADSIVKRRSVLVSGVVNWRSYVLLTSSKTYDSLSLLSQLGPDALPIPESSRPNEEQIARSKLDVLISSTEQEAKRVHQHTIKTLQEILASVEKMMATPHVGQRLAEVPETPRLGWESEFGSALGLTPYANSPFAYSVPAPSLPPMLEQLQDTPSLGRRRSAGTPAASSSRVDPVPSSSPLAPFQLTPDQNNIVSTIIALLQSLNTANGSQPSGASGGMTPADEEGGQDVDDVKGKHPARKGY